MAARLGLFEVGRSYPHTEVWIVLYELHQESNLGLRAWHCPDLESALNWGAYGKAIREFDTRYDLTSPMVPEHPDFSFLAVSIDFVSNQTLVFQVIEDKYIYLGSFNEQGSMEGELIKQKEGAEDGRKEVQSVSGSG